MDPNNNPPVNNAASAKPSGTESAATLPTPTGRPPRRAICLAGGGPAAGLHIGALRALEQNGITFNNEGDVWALSCIGAWVGIIYNQAPEGKEIETTISFFRDVFRDDKSFKSFPMNTIFSTDWAGNAEAMLDFMLRPTNYRNAFLPREIMRAFRHTLSAIRGGSTMRLRKSSDEKGEFEELEFKDFSEGDFNRRVLNDLLAVHPAVRFLTAMIYKSKVDGLSRLYYPDSSFLNNINFANVRNRKSFIYYNAWNLSRQELVLFANDVEKKFTPPSSAKAPVVGYKPVSAASLCACSALPYIEQTVTIDGDIYCEGALIDTVNFENLLQDNDLDEIWISRIVDASQVLPPRNLHDSLANLCELFCATVGEDDVELFKCRLKQDQSPKWTKIKVIEIPVSSTINFEWSHSNLEHGIKAGEDAGKRAVEQYRQKIATGERVITPPVDQEIVAKRRNLVRQRLIQAGRADQ